MRQLLIYDPTKRITARAALCHDWWAQEPKPHVKCVCPFSCAPAAPAFSQTSLQQVVVD